MLINLCQSPSNVPQSAGVKIPRVKVWVRSLDSSEDNGVLTIGHPRGKALCRGISRKVAGRSAALASVALDASCG